MRAVVIGGVNIDLVGTADAPMRRGDSNPGRLRVSVGGVGRNIAENLALLGAEVELMTALGDDDWADLIRANCLSRGIGLRCARQLRRAACGAYLCLNEPDGDLYAAVADMQVCAGLSPQWILRHLDALREADLIVVDANIPEESCACIAEQLRGKRIAADPVSAAKAGRLRPLLGALSLLKPNRAEAEALTGEGEPRTAATRLRQMGVENVFLTLGGEGVWWDAPEGSGLQSCLTGQIVNTSGCGDAFLAAACMALCRGLPAETAARAGQAAAGLCAASPDPVNPGMTWPRVLEAAGLAREL